MNVPEPKPAPDVVRFENHQRVFHVLDSEARGIVTGIIIRKTCVEYFVTWADMVERHHEDAELTGEKPTPDLPEPAHP